MTLELTLNAPELVSILREILATLQCIEKRGKYMSQQLDALKTQVAANTSVEESAVTLIEGLAAQLAAAGTDPAALQSLHDSLNKSASDLTAAVAANTPAAPVATP